MRDEQNTPLTYTSATPTFTPTYAGKAIYQFKLIVTNDANMESEPDYVIIATGLPVANAGGDQEVKVGAQVRISAKGSSPYPGGADITGFYWAFYEKPDEFNLVLPDTFTSKTIVEFVARYVGKYILVLIVKDADGIESIPTYVTITVTGVRGNPYNMDTDDDGISDGTEATIGTEINNPDTDGDMVWDGTELGYTEDDVTPDTDTNKFKPDFDKGFTKTDPTNEDTDGDGLFDGWREYVLDGIFNSNHFEFGEDTNINGYIEGDSGSNGNTWGKMDKYETWTESSPGLADSDDDGLWDGRDIDINNNGIYDPDVDYLGENVRHDLGEIRIYSDGRFINMVSLYRFDRTNNLNKDSDGDGLLDGTEVLGWIYYPSSFHRKLQVNGIHYYSDPNQVDSERFGIFHGEGIPDYIEYQKGTDPMDVDTDKDGLSDGFELLTLSTGKHYNYGRDVKVWNSLPDEHEPNPLKKDIYVEVDWMIGTLKEGVESILRIPSSSTIPHGFSNDGKNRVINAFKNSPVTNPDGSTGIILHIDDGTNEWGTVGQGGSIPHEDVISLDKFIGNKDINSEDNLYGLHFYDYREGLFHYSVFGHEDDNDDDFLISIQGIGGTGSNWIWISDDRISSWKNQAQTFMHELGHNFELNADNCWASTSTGIITGYPNDPISDSVYPSVMRYGTESIIDYSSKTGTRTFDHFIEKDGLGSWWDTITIDLNDWAIVEKNIGIGIKK